MNSTDNPAPRPNYTRPSTLLDGTPSFDYNPGSARGRIYFSARGRYTL